MPLISDIEPDRIPGKFRIVLCKITHVPAELLHFTLFPINTSNNQLLCVRISVRNFIINITVMLCGKFFGFLIFHNFYPGLCILCSFGILCFFLFCTGLIHFLISGRCQCIINIFLYAVSGQINTASNQKQDSCQNRKHKN